MVVTTGNARSTPRLRRSGLVTTGIFACVSVLASCGSGDGREPTDVGDDVPTTSADDTVPVEGAAMDGEVGVEDQSDPDQLSAGEAADTDERVAGPEGSDDSSDTAEPAVVETIIDEPDDPTADDPDHAEDVEEPDDVEDPEIFEVDDGETITVSPADDDDVPSDDGQDSDSQDGSSNEAADADEVSDAVASDSPDETPALPVEDRAQVLQLAVEGLNGKLFDVSSVAGRDVLLWFWSPL